MLYASPPRQFVTTSERQIRSNYGRTGDLHAFVMSCRYVHCHTVTEVVRLDACGLKELQLAPKSVTSTEVECEGEDEGWIRPQKHWENGGKSGVRIGDPARLVNVNSWSNLFILKANIRILLQM